jgi:hypothetical protein
MVNESSRAIEVYSVDFDDTYLEEEELLRSAPGYGADGLLRLPVRHAGKPLPPSVTDRAAEAHEDEPGRSTQTQAKVWL